MVNFSKKFRILPTVFRPFSSYKLWMIINGYFYWVWIPKTEISLTQSWYFGAITHWIPISWILSIIHGILHEFSLLSMFLATSMAYTLGPHSYKFLYEYHEYQWISMNSIVASATNPLRIHQGNCAPTPQGGAPQLCLLVYKPHEY